MDLTLKELFDSHLSKLKFDKKMLDQFYRLQVKYVNKNDQHMSFFGGNLTGVHQLSFTPGEYNAIYQDILDIDVDAIREQITHVPDIVMSRKVTSDPFNLTMSYCIHRFLSSPLLDEKNRHRGALQVALFFSYKLYTNMANEWFKFPVDERLATATYVNLSNRFLLKQLGSWQALFNYRAEEYIGKDSIHYKPLLQYRDDGLILNAIADHRGRIADYLKNIYAVTVETHANGERIDYNSSIGTDIEGQEMIKDRVGGVESMIDYLFNIIHDKRSFIREDLVDIVCRVMHTMQRRGFVKVLEWVSETANTKNSEDLDLFIREVIRHSYTYLMDNGLNPELGKDMPQILAKLKGMYLSSRSTDETLLKLRDVGMAVITAATGKTNEQTGAAIRNGLFLYLSLRTFTRQYYSH